MAANRSKPFPMLSTLHLLLLAAFSAPQACLSDALTSKFNVLIPKNLSRPDGYDHRDAMFGIPPYGGSIQQPLYYAKSDMCGMTGGGVAKLDTTGWVSPFILLIDRGNCSFVQKVRNSQRAGASAVVIADNTCLCDRTACTSLYTEKTEESEDLLPNCETMEPLMADDGSGSDISIPSFLLFKEDAMPIREALINNGHVRVQMTFSVPAPDSRVEYDLWTSPADIVTRELQEDFFSAVQALQNHAFFTPHMFIYDGVYAGCHGEYGEDSCWDLCTNAGRYCSIELDVNSGATGQEVVTEALRRICIWNLYGHVDGIGLPWWEYVRSFTELCDSGNMTSGGKMFSDDGCIAGAMAQAGVDKKQVDTCMEESGGTTEDKNNTLLTKELADQLTSGVVIIPSLMVNQAIIRGFLNFDTTFKAICSGFASGSEPDICVECSNCQDERTCVQQGFCGYQNDGFLGIDTTNGNIAFTTFIAILGIVLALFSFVAYVQYQRQNTYMRQQIQSVVAEYMPVTSQNNGASTSLALDEDDEDNNGNRKVTTFQIS